jgi:hypothetical protein
MTVPLLWLSGDGIKGGKRSTMKTSTMVAVGIWVLVVGGNIVQAQLLPPQTFTDAPGLPWQIVFIPVVVVVGAFFSRGHPGEFVMGRWVDGRFGQGVYREFMGALRLELLLAAMCLGIVLSALARSVFFKTPVLPPTIMGFFTSGAVAFLVAYYIRRVRGNPTLVPSSMAKPTLMQRYYLFQIAWMRWFGVVFASAAILITGSNLPWLIRSRDLKLIATNVGGGAGFFLIGLALYLIGTAVQRRYRAHIAQQID